MGGSPERAREHFEKAVEIAEGNHAGAYVSLAMTVSVPAQDAQEFRDLLNEAVAVDLEAAPLSRILADLGLSTQLTERIGRPPR